MVLAKKISTSLETPNDGRWAITPPVADTSYGLCFMICSRVSLLEQRCPDYLGRRRHNRSVLHKVIANRIFPAISFRNAQTLANSLGGESLRNCSFVQAFPLRIPFWVRFLIRLIYPQSSPLLLPVLYYLFLTICKCVVNARRIEGKKCGECLELYVW